MVLNEFLQIKLGVKFENKYNKLAVKEVCANKEKYPNIYDEIISQLECAEDEQRAWDYESGYFDCDDECCAGYDETMELYHAFLCAFAKTIVGKSIQVKYATFGLNYLEHPNIHNILDPHFHYIGLDYISIYPKRTEFIRDTFYPAVQGQVYLGTVSSEQLHRTYAMNNDEVLEKIADGIRILADTDHWFSDRFDNKGLTENPIRLDNDEIGYPHDCYEVLIGKNFLRFFATDRGFDPLNELRYPIINSLTDEQRTHPIVNRIELLR